MNRWQLQIKIRKGEKMSKIIVYESNALKPEIFGPHRKGFFPWNDFLDLAFPKGFDNIDDAKKAKKELEKRYNKKFKIGEIG